MASSGEAQEIVIAEISSLHGGRNPCRPIFPAFNIQLPSNQRHCGENHSNIALANWWTPLILFIE
jgi:hypothetical protein